MTGKPHVDETHDPALRSWVESAHADGTDFPIQNLPCGTFRHEFEERPRVGIAIGDVVLDCLEAARAGCLPAKRCTSTRRWRKSRQRRRACCASTRCPIR